MKDLALLIINILFLTILAHALLSWLLLAGVRNDTVMRLYQTISMALDPIYRPLRRVIPAAGMLDLTPLIAIIVLIILQRAIVSLG
ncbi:MAG: YggT family protein [Chloroflexota bacterium]|nr:YggT family protein [Chloroflexota bacterium]MDE2884935.1 YggT family protein [Chloroflexota bacterium]